MRPARRFDRAAYQERNRVERLVGRLKQYRRVAPRYEQRAATFRAMVTLRRRPAVAVGLGTAQTILRSRSRRAVRSASFGSGLWLVARSYTGQPRSRARPADRTYSSRPVFAVQWT
jgi:hypothetical protein